ncbi:hypothetical protein HIM_09128 [Hirsutella minnesotensis 3608]|uniref:Uncharacterized protein n=1 Tax=Hirsutella minnesotensis 3608 TaxID=1043627 RepID=A0A0F8A3A5_9HYPO|nr:hypothetical protein HIM_09128 [Hirsutella minnesotensis 3608]
MPTTNTRACTQLLPMHDERELGRTTERTMPAILAIISTALQSHLCFFRRSATTESQRATGDLVIESQPSGQRQLFCAKPLPRDSLIRWSGSDNTLPIEISSIHPQIMGSKDLFASGINWAFVHQGESTQLDLPWESIPKSTYVDISPGAILVSVAAEQSANAQNSAIERKAFVDGLTCLLRGLPSTLNTDEAEQIRSALPVHMSSKVVTSVRSDDVPPVATSGLPRSFVHRSVQTIVVKIFQFVQFVLPYLLVLVKHAAALERRYKVAEAVVGYGMDFVNAKAEQCANFTSLVLNEDDGKARQGMSGVAAWAAVEVVRGILHGVGEGLVVVRHKDAAGSRHPWLEWYGLFC